MQRTLPQHKKEFFLTYKNIGKSGNLETIIAAEKTLVQFDLKEHANSTVMKSNLNASLDELAAIETHIGLVGDPKK